MTYLGIGDILRPDARTCREELPDEDGLTVSLSIECSDQVVVTLAVEVAVAIVANIMSLATTIQVIDTSY